MGGRIAEIGEHAIAKVFREKPIEPSDHLGNASMISADYLPHLLGIEARRQHRRVDEVAEHHGQLASLGNAGRSNGWDGGERCCGCWLNIPQRRDGIEQSAAVPDRSNTELTQILARESTQNLPINVVVVERGPIFFEPEAAQPFSHIHRSCSETASLGDHYNPGAEFCPGCLGRPAGGRRCCLQTRGEAVASPKSAIAYLGQRRRGTNDMTAFPAHRTPRLGSVSDRNGGITGRYHRLKASGRGGVAPCSSTAAVPTTEISAPTPPAASIGRPRPA
jgi:hypothetical protein